MLLSPKIMSKTPCSKMTQCYKSNCVPSLHKSYVEVLASVPINWLYWEIQTLQPCNQVRMKVTLFLSVRCVLSCIQLFATHEQWVIKSGPPGCSVHGASQARILEWVAISSSRGSSQPRNRTHISSVSCVGRQLLYHCATQEVLILCDWDLYKHS